MSCERKEKAWIETIDLSEQSLNKEKVLVVRIGSMQRTISFFFKSIDYSSSIFNERSWRKAFSRVTSMYLLIDKNWTKYRWSRTVVRKKIDHDVSISRIDFHPLNSFSANHCHRESIVEIKYMDVNNVVKVKDHFPSHPVHSLHFDYHYHHDPKAVLTYRCRYVFDRRPIDHYLNRSLTMNLNYYYFDYFVKM